MPAAAALALCLLTAAAAAQQAPKDGAVSPARQAQRFARELELPDKRTAAVDSLLLLGADAVPALLQQAQHPDLATARVALQVVAALSHDGLAAVPKLRELAQGDSPHAQAAAWALARLPHRGTFLVPSPGDDVVIELDAQGKEVWRSPKIGNAWAANVLANGNLLVAALDRGAREYDATGKLLGQFGDRYVYSAERLIDGNTLIASYVRNRVAEYDAAGNEVWTNEVTSPMHATRLPAGQTLIADYSHGRLLEVDRAGATTWEVGGLPNAFSCHRERDGTTWVLLQQPAVLRKLDRRGETISEQRLAAETSHVLPLPDGTIQAGNMFVRRCDGSGKELWRVKIAGWAGRVTLR